jgi:hypothetical protein
MKLTFHSSSLKWPGREVELVSPTPDLEGLYACRLWSEPSNGLIIFGDTECLRKLAYLFIFIAQRKGTILYVPLKHRGLTKFLKRQAGDQAAVDLVIAHHSLQFKPKAWKPIRNGYRYRSHEYRSCVIEEMILKRADAIDRRTFSYRDNKDVLDLRLFAQTAFLIGSARVFEAVAADCKAFADDENEKWFDPSDTDQTPHIHMDIYLRKPSGWDQFLIDFYDRNLWKE